MTPKPPPVLLALLRDRRGIRDAVILAEVLGPPGGRLP